MEKSIWEMLKGCLTAGILKGMNLIIGTMYVDDIQCFPKLFDNGTLLGNSYMTCIPNNNNNNNKNTTSGNTVWDCKLRGMGIYSTTLPSIFLSGQSAGPQTKESWV